MGKIKYCKDELNKFIKKAREFLDEADALAKKVEYEINSNYHEDEDFISDVSELKEEFTESLDDFIDYINKYIDSHNKFFDREKI